ncbi:MAG: hypothetical protein IJZ82_08815 [Lachnospiraceae bacterium]|nr:hypothetical protein [Lachnospiraceae bacterium]
MSKKVTGIVAYIALIGWLIAFLAGDKEGAKFHLNQALVVNVAVLINNLILSWILGLIPVLGGFVSLIISIFLLVCWILGLVYAIKEENKEVPVLGAIKILK